LETYHLIATHGREFMKVPAVGIIFVLTICACSGDTFQTPSPGARLSIDCASEEKVTQLYVDGVPLFVLCRSEEDLNTLEQLDNYVYEPDVKSVEERQFRAERRDVFIVIGISPYTRCTVQFEPKGSNEWSWSDVDWPGGFYSLCHGEVFDMAGRQIKPGKFSPTDFPGFIGNLVVPEYRFVSDTEVEFK